MLRNMSRMNSAPPTAPDLLALLKASIAEQRAADARRLPVGPARCGDHGQHAWRNPGPGFGYIEHNSAGDRLVACECGARARIDREGRMFQADSWQPVAEPAARAA